ncbi:unnamed protein product [Urochloa humidicola]
MKCWCVHPARGGGAMATPLSRPFAPAILRSPLQRHALLLPPLPPRTASPGSWDEQAPMACRSWNKGRGTDLGGEKDGISMEEAMSALGAWCRRWSRSPPSTTARRRLPTLGLRLRGLQRGSSAAPAATTSPSRRCSSVAVAFALIKPLQRLWRVTRWRRSLMSWFVGSTGRNDVSLAALFLSGGGVCPRQASVAIGSLGLKS